MTATPGPHRIVVGVDMSTTGDVALVEAMRLSRLTEGSELHVTYVISSDKDLHDANRLSALSDELRASLEKLKEHTAAVCAPAQEQDSYVQNTVFHVRLGSAAEALHQVAVDIDADLMVVGTHGRTGVERLVLGSVAEQLLRIARLPVVVARPRDLAALPKTEKPDAARPGAELHDSARLTDRLHLEFRPRSRHISGLV